LLSQKLLSSSHPYAFFNPAVPNVLQETTINPQKLVRKTPLMTSVTCPTASQTTSGLQMTDGEPPQEAAALHLSRNTGQREVFTLGARSPAPFPQPLQTAVVCNGYVPTQTIHQLHSIAAISYIISLLLLSELGNASQKSQWKCCGKVNVFPNSVTVHRYPQNFTLGHGQHTGETQLVS